MRKLSKKQWLAIGLVGVLLIAGAIAVITKKPSEPVANPEVRPTPVKTAAVKSGSLSQTVNLAARIVPDAEVGVVSKITGTVAQVPVQLGDRVNAGQTLIQLDTWDINLQVQQAEAALEVAQANQRSAAALQANARANLERMQQLQQQGLVSQRELEAAQLAYDQAAAGVADAQVRQAEATLASARNQLANATITAPINGLVSSRKVDPGDTASANTPLLTLVSIDQVFAECNVPESEVGLITPGKAITVKVPAVSSQPISGTLAQLAPAADAQSKAFTAKIALPNPGESIKPGMFGEVELVVAERRDVLLVPKEAVLERGEQRLVFIVKADQAVETRIKTGISDNLNTEILDGLQLGEQVVVSGQTALQNGTPVETTGSGDR